MHFSVIFFPPLQQALTPYGTYFLFSGMCVVGLAFDLLIVPETKGKTLAEIAAIFGGGTDPQPVSRRSSKSSKSSKGSRY